MVELQNRMDRLVVILYCEPPAQCSCSAKVGVGIKCGGSTPDISRDVLIGGNVGSQAAVNFVFMVRKRP